LVASVLIVYIVGLEPEQSKDSYLVYSSSKSRL